jgi:hypothetical protein
VRRVSGLLPGAFLEREVTGPLGIVVTIGLPEKEAGRAAELVQPPVAQTSEQAAIFGQLAPAAIAAVTNPGVSAAGANTPEWRAAEIPAANGHGTARAVAALYGIFAGRGAYDGHRVLSPEAAERVREGQGSCRDLVLGAGLGRESEVGLGCGSAGRTARTGPTRAPSDTTASAARAVWPTRRRACRWVT